MRSVFCEALAERARSTELVFLTGDLGYQALEPLRDLLGDHFVNTGIAEQNMVSMAAGLASEGCETWVYSIAPFLYARAFEQVRNDVCFHNYSVRLVGNGGGFAYGVMGPSHHAIEDYGALLTLPNMTCFVPSFDGDVEEIVSRASEVKGPFYLRLGRSELEVEGNFADSCFSWRSHFRGSAVTAVFVGPRIGAILNEVYARRGSARLPNIWSVCTLRSDTDLHIPNEFFEDVRVSSKLVIVEEHVTHGSFASRLILQFAKLGLSIPPVRLIAIDKKTQGIYGSQEFLRESTGLGVGSICAELGMFEDE